jgi:hypothetical protein
MSSSSDISVNLPAELLDSFSQVIHTGLQRAKIPQDERQNLSSWWEAEEEFLREELTTRGLSEDEE